MEAVLEKMKLDASQLPEAQRKKVAEDLKVLEGNKDTVEQVLSDLGASLNSVPRGDRDQLKAKLKEEAWLPTKAAIGVRLCLLHPLLCSCALPNVDGLHKLPSYQQKPAFLWDVLHEPIIRPIRDSRTLSAGCIGMRHHSRRGEGPGG